MNNTILVIAAHPDDEVLGCGGTIAKHIQNGDKVFVHILAQGITSRNQNEIENEVELKKLRKCAQNCHRQLNTTYLKLHDLPDNRMDSLDLLDITKTIEKIIKDTNPNIVYTHHIGDLNIDHQLTHKAVVTACRPINNSPVKTLLFFEIPSSTEWQTPGSHTYFQPNWFENIENTLELKLSALKAYNSELRQWPHSRSIEAVEYLARYRGSFVGTMAAEAFVLGRLLK